MGLVLQKVSHIKKLPKTILAVTEFNEMGNMVGGWQALPVFTRDPKSPLLAIH